MPVGIVGAGPVGLACALRLGALGVPSVILEKEPRLRREGSKACCIQGDVLEILDELGCAEALASEGIAWDVSHTYVRGKELFTTEFPATNGYPPFVNISQLRTEEIILERLTEEGVSKVLWSHAVAGVAPDDDGVTVSVDTPNGPRDLRFRYLVACDGFHSDVRRLLDVAWTGHSYGTRFLITDVRVALPLAKERHFHYDPPFNPGRQVVLHAQPDDVWRIDWHLPPGADVESGKRTDGVDWRIRAIVGDLPYEIVWLTTYRFHHRVVARMRTGRVFFAGDAAHALPPYGARGMNSGIQDVDNLAWKLNLVVNQGADERLLESYHDERHAAARENLRVTEATFRFMAPPARLARWRRNALLRLAPHVRSLHRHVNSGRMAEPFVYSESPIVDTAGSGDLVGSLAPDGEVIVEGRRRSLRSLLGGEFVCFCFVDDAQEARGFLERARGPETGSPVRFLVIVPGEVASRTSLPEGVAALDGPPGVAGVYRSNGPVWYLLRPDRHIAASGAIAPAADGADRFRRALDASAGLQ